MPDALRLIDKSVLIFSENPTVLGRRLQMYIGVGNRTMALVSLQDMERVTPGSPLVAKMQDYIREHM